MTTGVALQRRSVHSGAHELSVLVAGAGPLIVCVHGWPELASSWQHQIAYFAARGHRVAALDVRGYGGSSKPRAVAEYTLRALASDIVAVLDALGEGEAVVFGHDWGAPIAWHTSLLYPARIRAVALLSVPYAPPGRRSFIDHVRAAYGDRFFYQAYFEEEGRAEAELEADTAASLRKIYHALSGSAPLNEWLKARPAGARLMDDLADPARHPAWMSEAEFGARVRAFESGGFRGPLNRYRAQAPDVHELSGHVGQRLAQPSCFVAGERDMIRAMVPGLDLYADPGAACSDFRGSTLITGAGHWVHQEAPDEVNRALGDFVDSL